MADEPEGFRASLNDATLADLVQMKCLSGSRGAYRVTSQGSVGFLFFDGGGIQHAIAADAVGEAAALEILSWQRGTFEPCDAPWPATPTVGTTWQNLLMRAAQARDESGRHVVSELRSSMAPPRPTKPPRPPSAQRAREGVGASTELTAPAHHPSEPPPHPVTLRTPVVPRPASPSAAAASGAPRGSVPPPTRDLSRVAVQGFVRLDADGNTLTRSGDDEGLGPSAAYALRLADVIGEALGLGSARALEWSTQRGRTFAHREPSGRLVALRTPHDADLRALRERFGL